MVLVYDSRLNDILENILQLSQRERSRPETLNLGDWAHGFVDEYKQGDDIGNDSLRVIDNSAQPVVAVADPQQLHQVIWNLVQNALRYSRMPGGLYLARQMAEANQAVLEYVRVAGGGSFRWVLTPPVQIEPPV